MDNEVWERGILIPSERNKSLFYDKRRVTKGKVSDINLNICQVQRGGVILYTVNNGIVYFGLGIDSQYHELTDFGGKIIFNENPIIGALREFREETLEIFKSLNIEDVSNCFCLCDKYNLIIFVRINLDPNFVSKLFLQKFHTVNKSEICAITWLTKEELKYAISKNNIVFSVVADFLSRAGNFYRFL